MRQPRRGVQINLGVAGFSTGRPTPETACHWMLQLRDDGSVDNSPQRFLNLTVRGFRRLAEVDLELRPLTVLIGANGVGKSSLLDVLSILASSAQGNLN